MICHESDSKKWMDLPDKTQFVLCAARDTRAALSCYALQKKMSARFE
jgi:hypothetical protein